LTADEFLAALAKLSLAVCDSGPVVGRSRASVYRYASGRTPIPEPVRRILKSEVEACMVRQYKLRDGSVTWQGYRHGKPIGPPAEDREQAFRFALDLPR
jgi:hypothetical protein